MSSLTGFFPDNKLIATNMSSLTGFFPDNKLIATNMSSLTGFFPNNKLISFWIASFLAMTGNRVQCNRRNIRRLSVIARYEAIQSFF
jgi:hypothetical protein